MNKEKGTEKDPEEKSKMDRSRHKILAAIIIFASLWICIYSFLSQFNLLFQVDPENLGITLKQTVNIEITPFFFLFGFLAFLGSMVRVIFDFIGHTCYTEKFDFKVWWPWYIFRPTLGFILGAVFVILFDKSLFGIETNEISKFPFVLSFITGFAVTDAIDLLRNFSKRIFGVGKKDE
jgi:hypothetical protein